MAEINAEVEVGDLKTLFECAASHVKGIVQNLTKQQILEFYGFYKQATEGPCLKGKPHWYELTEKQKWEAWSILSNMDSNTAMEKYVGLLREIDPKWTENPVKETSSSWVHHSCMRNDEETVQDSDKTIFDWVKERNVEMVKRYKGKDPEIDGLDETGLSLLHWAADRGSLPIVEYLVSDLGADVNVRDVTGQTPLHFAVSCEYQDVAEFLLKAGADANIKDNDGLTAYES